MIVGTVGGGGRDGVHRVRPIASPVSESVVVFSPLAKRDIATQAGCNTLDCHGGIHIGFYRTSRRGHKEANRETPSPTMNDRCCRLRRP